MSNTDNAIKTPLTLPKKGEMICFGEPQYNQIMQQLIQEAKALDELRLGDWLNLLDDDIFYHMPLRRTLMRDGGSQFDTSTNWYHENKASLEFKVRRIEAGSAWAEDPATRVRRLISNLTLYKSAEPDTYYAESYLLVTRSRGEETSPDVISARRDDVVKLNADGFKILQRSIFLDQTVLGIPSLAFFL